MNPFRIVALGATLYAAGLTAPAHAQTAPVPDTARVFKHQLGFTASPQLENFFTANRVLPIELIYRCQTQPNRATRMRAGGRYNFNVAEAPLLLGTAYREHIGSLELAYGRERWLPLTRRLTAYAGAEAGLRFNLYRRDYKIYAPGVPVYNPGYPPTLTTGVSDGTETRNTQTVFLQFLAGIRFQASRRLCAEMEAGLPIAFSRETYKLDFIYYDVNTGLLLADTHVKAENTYYSFFTQFNPINRLHLIFLF